MSRDHITPYLARSKLMWFLVSCGRVVEVYIAQCVSCSPFVMDYNATIYFIPSLLKNFLQVKSIIIVSACFIQDATFSDSSGISVGKGNFDCFKLLR